MEDQILDIRGEDQMSHKGPDTWYKIDEIQMDHGGSNTCHVVEVLTSHEGPDVR